MMDSLDFKVLRSGMVARREERDRVFSLVESALLNEGRPDAVDALVSLAYKIDP